LVLLTSTMDTLTSAKTHGSADILQAPGVRCGRWTWTADVDVDADVDADVDVDVDVEAATSTATASDN